MTASVTRKWRTGIWVVFAGIIGLSTLIYMADLLLWPKLAAPLTLHNPDAWLRLSLLRDWLAGENFFDHSVSRTNAPFGGVVSPWTRPLDFILAALAKLMPANANDMKLLMTAAVYPALLAIAAAVTMAQGALKVFRHNHVLACTLILMIASPYMPDYFRPGDVDHHGLLSALWCGAVVLLLNARPSRASSLAMGALLGTVIWISPEGLMPFCALAAIRGFGALRAKDGAREQCDEVLWTATGCATICTLALFVEIPAGEIVKRTTYDTLSLAHAVFLWLCAAGAIVLRITWPNISSIRTRLAVAAIAGCAILVCMYALYPKFFHGPFVDADPYIVETFLPMVQEAQPLFGTLSFGLLRTLMEPALAAVLLAAAFFRCGMLRPERRRKLLVLGTLLALTFALTCFQTRWIYYMEPVAIIICAALLPVMAVRGRTFRFAPRRWQPYLWLVLATFVTTGASFAPLLLPAQAGTRPTAACLHEMRYVVETGQLQKLLGERPQVVYTLADLGGEVLFFSPHRIIAGNYHREADGMKDANALRTARSEAGLRAILKKRKVDALLYCPAYQAKGEVLATPPKWLTPVKGLVFAKPEGDKPVLLRP